MPSNYLFSLLLLLLSLPFIRAELECLPHLPLPPSHLNLSDHAADCRFLLSHLPSRPIRIYNMSRGLTWSASVPFLPHAYVRHRSCELQMTWLIERHLSPSFEDLIGSYYLRYPPIVDTWTNIRVIGERLVTQCVESGISGLGFFSAYRTMHAMSIGASLNIRGQWDRKRERFKGLMAGIDLPPAQDLGADYANDPWGSGTYDV